LLESSCLYRSPVRELFRSPEQSRKATLARRLRYVTLTRRIWPGEPRVGWPVPLVRSKATLHFVNLESRPFHPSFVGILCVAPESIVDLPHRPNIYRPTAADR
jgi:hypothetical protein